MHGIYNCTLGNIYFYINNTAKRSFNRLSTGLRFAATYSRSIT